MRRPSHLVDPLSLPPDAQNLPYLEGLFEGFARDPESVSPDWRRYFLAQTNGDRPLARYPRDVDPNDAARSSIGPASSAVPAISEAPTVPVDQVQLAGFQDKVNQMIRNYRVQGHTIAAVDPLGLPRPQPPELDLRYFAFSEAEMDRRVTCETIQYAGPLTLRDLVQRLRNTYCRSIGAQYMHINDLAIRRWLQVRMEGTENRLHLTRDEQVRILTRLTDAVMFEEFIRKKFIGAKSFSLEGCESLIPLLDLAIEKAGEQGTGEIILGMAHRGRLNVLANIMGKRQRQIFRELADPEPQRYLGGGDVKYHLGHGTEWTTSTGKLVRLSLCFNPSHLEFVNAVALGRVRAKQDRAADTEQSGTMCLLIHGDAAFAGQGVVQETLNFSQLRPYSVGGALHVVVNNQIGFTTSPGDGRSTPYATDVAKMLQSPIFHVNGEDPEAVAQVVRLAMDFRSAFRRDVFIDMYGYRRLGHNETDEPAFTQPGLYRAIEQRKPVREGYLEHLLAMNEVTQQEADDIAAQRRLMLETELSESRNPNYEHPERHSGGVWLRDQYFGGEESSVMDVRTGVSPERLSRLLERLAELPPDFKPHPKIERILNTRREMAKGAQPLDWAAAEALAFASLATEGVRVRMTGQDSERGTFSHRHAVLHDIRGENTFCPLKHVAEDQGAVDICNSPLSEIGVLGFEYGYSLDCPDGLVLWEAQFGDFVNAAQVIVDQFIASGEDKWKRLSGLVLLLPHGFEGQGPEHSSARLERFLALAAEDNIQVVYPTTPAQIFHCLRRQVLRPWRKPLVVMSPKSLLRHPQAVSTLEDCARGVFRRVIADPEAGAATSLVLVCSGKIYYELLQRREKMKNVAVIRLEQLYPLPESGLKAALAAFPDGTPVRWVQEEPENMGPWRFLRVHLGEKLFGRFPFAGVTRPSSASPATGSGASHKLEQQALLEQAFTPP